MNEHDDTVDPTAPSRPKDETDATDPNEAQDTKETPVAPDLLLHETQPVPAGASTTTALPSYPTLPAAYTLDVDPPDAPAVDTATTPADTSAPAAPAPAAAAPVRTARLPRVRTVTFGLVLLAISVISLVALMTDVRIDGGVVGLGLLIGAGAALVAGGVAAAMREARGGPGAVR